MFYTSYTRYFGFAFILRFIAAACQLKLKIRAAMDYKKRHLRDKQALSVHDSPV
jgi:hypothetical protein